MKREETKQLARNSVIVKKEKAIKVIAIRSLICLQKIDPGDLCHSTAEIEDSIKEARDMWPHDKKFQAQLSIFEQQLPALQKKEIVAKIKMAIRLHKFRPKRFDRFMEDFQPKLDRAEKLGVDVSGYLSQFPKLAMLSAMKQIEHMIHCTEHKTVGIDSYTTIQIRKAMAEAEKIGCKTAKFNKRVRSLESLEEWKRKRLSEKNTK